MLLYALIATASADCAADLCSVASLSASIPANGAPILELHGTDGWDGTVDVTDTTTSAPVDVVAESDETGTGYVVVLDGPYEAGHAYDVTIPGCGGAAGSFTVEADPDTTAPANTPILQVRRDCQAVAEDQPANAVRATIGKVTGDRYEIEVSLYDTMEDPTSYVSTQPDQVLSTDACAANFWPDGETVYWMRGRAVDLAGNASPWSEVVESDPPDCEDTDVPPEVNKAGRCGCATGGDPSALGFLAGLGLLVRHLRRRQRAPGGVSLPHTVIFVR